MNYAQAAKQNKQQKIDTLEKNLHDLKKLLESFKFVHKIVNIDSMSFKVIIDNNYKDKYDTTYFKYNLFTQFWLIYYNDDTMIKDIKHNIILENFFTGNNTYYFDQLALMKTEKIKQYIINIKDILQANNLVIEEKEQKLIIDYKSTYTIKISLDYDQDSFKIKYDICESLLKFNEYEYIIKSINSVINCYYDYEYGY